MRSQDPPPVIQNASFCKPERSSAHILSQRFCICFMTDKGSLVDVPKVMCNRL